ncbi:hypothetical protein C9374_011495 [Naegleria lovaniensis]|uniref:Uncharacterized protein n=1 Tax=Naegleria lovaniensis TaxID=51637 RepID=A0AA88KWS3_NAELO|nr:uncharacterized protein C9374_011495 [Naegleria lovaniensis]KAG2392770.1 hypothetical protein C9374_011495 [Naegleria lovaniensis]
MATVEIVNDPEDEKPFGKNSKGFSGEFTQIDSHTFETIENARQQSKAILVDDRNEYFINLSDDRIQIYDMNHHPFKIIKTLKYPLSHCNCLRTVDSAVLCSTDHSYCLVLMYEGQYRMKLMKMSVSDGSLKWETVLNKHSHICKKFLTPVMDSRGIIYVGETTASQIYVICNETGQVLEKMGTGCRKPFKTSVKWFSQLSLDRDDHLVVFCYGRNDVPLLKFFTRNLQYVKAIQLQVYLMGPIMHEPISNGYLFCGLDTLYFASREFNIISQKAMNGSQYYNHFAFSNGVLLTFETYNNKLVCYK